MTLYKDTRAATPDSLTGWPTQQDSPLNNFAWGQWRFLHSSCFQSPLLHFPSTSARRLHTVPGELFLFLRQVYQDRAGCRETPGKTTFLLSRILSFVFLKHEKHFFLQDRSLRSVSPSLPESAERDKSMNRKQIFTEKLENS